MTKYMKKPVVVEAAQFIPPDSVPSGVVMDVGSDGKISAYVITIHDQRVYILPNDWVITEPDGIHHYPCKPAIFEATYEPVNITLEYAKELLREIDRLENILTEISDDTE